MGPVVETIKKDTRDFWIKRLDRGKAPAPKMASVPVGERYLTGNIYTSKMYDPENSWREFFSRHRCIACGRPFWNQEDAFNCHPEASAYIVWREYGCGCSNGSASPAEAIATAIYASASNGL